MGKKDYDIFRDSTTGKWRTCIPAIDGGRKNITGKTKKEVEQKKQAYYGECEQKAKKRVNTTLEECCYAIIELYYRLGHFGDTTYTRHIETCRRIGRTPQGKKPIIDITVDDINEFFVEDIKRYYKNTIKKDKTVLQWGFRYAMEQELISKNPMESVLININWKSMKNRKIRALTEEEQKKFLQVIEKNKDKLFPYSYIWLFLLYTGVRVGEACNLLLTDVNTTNRHINIVESKTNAGIRTIYYGPTLAIIIDEILKYRDDSSIYFFNNNGKKVNPSTVAKQLRELNEQAHIVVGDNSNDILTNHMLRHTLATRLIEQDTQVEQVSSILGHSDTSITEQVYYTEFKKQKNKNAQAVEDYWSKQMSNLSN